MFNKIAQFQSFLNQNTVARLIANMLLLFVFWLIVFDIQRLLFSIHNFSKVTEIGWWKWLGVFVHSIRLDLAMAGYLSVIPLIFLMTAIIWNKKWAKAVFNGFVLFEIVLVALIHAGEINAYPEWNHKLTGRVFTHLLHPDEVVRTADFGMMIGYIAYAAIEIFTSIKLKKFFFGRLNIPAAESIIAKVVKSVIAIPVGAFLCLLLARGGFQPIPINTDAAFYTNNYVANDISVNSTYFFGKSFMLYNRTDIDQYIMNLSEEDAIRAEKELFDYPLEHDRFIFSNKRPNIVFLILESWTGNAIGAMTDTPSATPYFDALTKEGLFFNRIYGVSGTSEIGNSAIFSGYPGVPEISITMQADKHRKIPCLNEDLKLWNYTSAYLFSGDLKYGNIGGYFSDHGFDVVEDELDFPKNLKRGKLNYYDEDLYALLIQKMSKLPEPFMQCAFTGSTHSPYDFPHPEKYTKFDGVEGTFLNSLQYADKCLQDFMENAKKQPWFDNTIFIMVADHGHASNVQQNPSESAYNRIPLLIYGKPLKAEFVGKTIEKLGSQADIVRTLLYQMGGDYQRYRWSKDLLNPKAPEFALHTINRGYGWVTPTGNFTYHMENKILIENKYPASEYEKELKRCRELLALIYSEYKQL